MGGMRKVSAFAIVAIFTITVFTTCDNTLDLLATIEEEVKTANAQELGYTVTYDGNGHTGGNVPADPADYLEGRTVTVLGNAGSLVRTYYSFATWNTNFDGSGASYTTQETFAMPAADVTLYAQWTALRYTVTYDGNGATGTALGDSSDYLGDAMATVKGLGTLAKDFHTFTGWNSASDGSGTAYAIDATFTITGNATLYAIWAASTYVAGSFQNDSGIYVPCFWIGTERTSLPANTETYNACATAIYLYGGTIYTAGYYYNGTKQVACYWAGTTKTDLVVTTNPGYSTTATSIYVTSSGVYTGGYYSDGLYGRPCYWADTTRQDFYRPASASSSVASIYVYDNTVYASGKYLNGDYYVPCYWAGASTLDIDTRKDLAVTGETTHGYAQSIYVTSGPTVYTGGFCVTSSVWTACYWSGQTRQDLVVAGASDTSANSICISDGTIYAAGNYWLGTSMVPCYWHGTGASMTKQDLDPGSCQLMEATSICVSDGTVYTAGYGRDVYYASDPCLWTGTVKTELEGHRDNSDPVAIAVPLP